MKEILFLIQHKKQPFYFLFNRTLGTVNELIDVQDLKDDDFSKKHLDWYIKWEQNKAKKVFKVSAVLTEFTACKREVIKKVRNWIIAYFLENEN